MNSDPSLRVGLFSLVVLALTACSRDGGDGARDEGPGSMESEGSGTGWAVVVGISRYEDFPPVDGATTRAERMGRVFRNTWGIPEANIRLLLDESATRDAIRETLVYWLPARASEEDEIVVFLSGHGSTVRDASGDEEDGLDEAFCPTDAAAEGPERDIVDDSLSTWLERLPTDRVTLIMEGQRFEQGDFDAQGAGSAGGSMVGTARTGSTRKDASSLTSQDDAVVVQCGSGSSQPR